MYEKYAHELIILVLLQLIWNKKNSIIFKFFKKFSSSQILVTYSSFTISLIYFTSIKFLQFFSLNFHLFYNLISIYHKLTSNTLNESMTFMQLQIVLSEFYSLILRTDFIRFVSKYSQIIIIIISLALSLFCW